MGTVASTVSPMHLNSYSTVIFLLLTTTRKREKREMFLLFKNQLHPQQQTCLLWCRFLSRLSRHCNLYIKVLQTTPINKWFFSRGDVPPNLGTSGNLWRHSGLSWMRREVRLVSNRQRPGMLLILLQSIGGPAQQRMLWPKWQLRMRNSAIGPKSKKNYCSLILKR